MYRHLQWAYPHLLYVLILQIFTLQIILFGVFLNIHSKTALYGLPVIFPCFVYLHSTYVWPLVWYLIYLFMKVWGPMVLVGFVHCLKCEYSIHSINHSINHSGFPSFLSFYFLPQHGQGKNCCPHHLAWLDCWTSQSHLSCLLSSRMREIFLSLHPHWYAWCLHETKLRNHHAGNSSRPLFVFYLVDFLFGVFFFGAWEE